MAYSADVIKVMIASPGDVAKERHLAREVIHEWNAVHSQERRTVLLPVAWETHASPAMGARAQEIINNQLLRDCDLLIGIFWTRLGTPTGKESSGTVEEIEEHLAASKPAMLYFSTAPVRPDSIDESQYRALREFKESCRTRGLVEEYESIEEFREKLWRQVAQTVIRVFTTRQIAQRTSGITGRTGAAGSLPRENLVRPEDRLSSDARELLREAAKDPNGTVLATETFGGASVETNGRDFVERGNPRSEARWRQAVRDLTHEGHLEQRDLNGEVSAVTASGYRLADSLGQSE